MENKKKKSKLLIASLIIIAGIVIAVTVGGIIQAIVKAGTVKVDKINLKLTDANGNESKELRDWEPGDIDMISWKVKNIGTAAVYTRNKLQIYWNEPVDDELKVIYLYPANMSRQEILNDFKKGEEAEYAIPVEIGTIDFGGSVGEKVGIQYEFLGDVLDGTKMTGKSQEVDYNLQANVKTTDDNSSTEDDIAFYILFSPKTSFVFENKTVTINVITEAMQCTAEGKAEWQIVDSQSIGD
ncbi:MAG: hypothetical protein E7252_09445 [Lachnospira sp.]|nr:hypothetical protein [Lachnospira sp.]